ncbi:MAG: glyoxylate/hydroxypyruvate reductase A [Alphaproteobacteria bacterium]|nr:glyoxylate/hydroxypyruvate reductase A [Alphaproteobacteria bacterium]HCP01314.1 glyoxylate/hydroxypyruvate reductase A [Rhodospirillaceae bacterium]
MALLITPPVTGSTEYWGKCVKALMPALDIRLWPDVGAVEDINYLLTGFLDLAELPRLPNLRLVMPMFAGFDHLLGHSDLPNVPIVRTGPPDGDPAMTEYALLHVLRHHRQMPDYLAQQRRAEWRVRPQKLPREQRVGFMGFGALARPPARVLCSLGFDVAAWRRSEGVDPEVEIFHGPATLPAFLVRTDILVCLLPLTSETEGILNAELFSLMPTGASVINLARGSHLVDIDLIAALDSGQLTGATLDATNPEPLPPESPLWQHPGITVMPHTARRVRADVIAPQVIEIIRRDMVGDPQLSTVDRSAGY